MRRRKRILLAQKRSIAATLSGLMGLGATVRAQQILMPPPSYPTTPAAVLAQQESGAGYVGGFQSVFNTFPSVGDLLTWGPAVAHPHASYSANYSTGINSAPGQANDSFIQSFTPGVTVAIGTHITLDYEPTFTFYSSSNLKDTINHQVSLSAGTAYEDWVFGLSQGYSLSGDPNAQTGAQTSVQSFQTGLSASYRFNSLISSDTSFSQLITSADQFTSSTSWSGTEFINYQFFPTLTGGVGVTYGYDVVSQGQNMSHEQLQARLNWRVFSKLSLSVHGGVEDRQFIGGGVPDLISPVYGASVEYAAGPHTSLALTVDHGVTPSLLFSQASETTTVAVNMGQRLFKHFTLNANVSYNKIEYLATSQNVMVAVPVGNNLQLFQSSYLVPGRSDTSYNFNTSLSWSIRRHLSMSLTYNYSHDSSSAGGLSFSTSQEGASVSYNF